MSAFTQGFNFGLASGIFNGIFGGFYTPASPLLPPAGFGFCCGNPFGGGFSPTAYFSNINNYGFTSYVTPSFDIPSYTDTTSYITPSFDVSAFTNTTTYTQPTTLWNTTAQMSSASNTLTSTFWGNQQNLWGDTFSRSTPSIYNPTSSSTTSNTQHSSSNSSSSGSRVKTWNKMTNSEMLATYGNYTRSITDKYKGTEADLNKYLADKGVLKGKAKAFLAAQEKYNINAAVLVAICVHETKLGTSSLAINKNNVGGIRISGSNSFQAFPTIEKCIDTMGSILRNGYADQGLTKLYQVNAKYCPATDPTDKKGTNGIWAKKVNEYLDNIEKVRA